MSVEFKRSGTGVVKDHNELANKGIRTHAEIDQYMDELDVARGSDSSIGARLDNIETNVADDVLEIAAIQAKQAANEALITTSNVRISVVEAEIAAARNGQTNLDSRLDAMQTQIDQGGSGQEVMDARVDKNGVLYATLKERLDATQGVGGGNGGGSGSGGGAAGSLFYYESGPGERVAAQNTFTIPQYAMNQHALIVTVDGAMNYLGTDYTETTTTSIVFNRLITTDARVVIIGLGGKVNQVTKTNIAGSVGTPYVFDIPIPYTQNFDVNLPSVLRFIAGAAGLISTIDTFDNTDVSNFVADAHVSLDGVMHMITKIDRVMANDGALGSGVQFSYPIPLSTYLKVEKVEVI